MTARNQPQMYGPSRGGAPRGVCSVHAPAADEAQDGGHPASVGQPLGYLLPPTLPLNGRACLARRRGHFHSLLRSHAVPMVQRHKRAGRILPIGWPAANLCRAIMRRGSQSQFGNHSPCRVTDLPKTYHLERSSSVAGFDVPKRNERRHPNVRESIGAVRNE